MTELYLQNTQTGEKTAFTPIDPAGKKVTMYVCGPTVYNYVHIGNARPVVVFDTLFRVLQSLYPDVVYARNLTDVDDKINAAAHANGESILSLTTRFADAFHEDMAQLNALTPTIEPRATETIAEMVELIDNLIQKGHAYVADGHVLFDVTSDPNYGELSSRKLEDMLAGARVEIADYKQNPADFVLWKPSKESEPSWPSPWGDGRPGWHLECTAMINKHLGDRIDIHGGGQDLIFPHHENERAQGQCAHGTNYVNIWLHNGYINIDGEKMSKSLGNFKLVRELLKNFHGEVLRFALLMAHYRSPLNWTEDLLTDAKKQLDGFYTALRKVQQVAAVPLNDVSQEPAYQALLDDLNTPLAISELHQLTRQLNKTEVESEQAILKGRLLACANLLGILQEPAETWFKQPSQEGGLSDANIDALIQARAEAKAAKDFSQADAIRDQLTKAGIALEDTANGTQWTRS
ncbi:MAG: cysteine--tRNA ligase [Pseudomonadota bacterium]|nr:cysteine--tRNA ligase [Pseudomonadota bacterium]